MASNESDLINAILPWILGIASIIASIWAGMKILICKGKNIANGDNWKSLIESKIQDISDRFETFKKWADSEHEAMNDNVEKKYSELLQVITELKEGQAETNGYLKRLAEEKN